MSSSEGSPLLYSRPELPASCQTSNLFHLSIVRFLVVRVSESLLGTSHNSYRRNRLPAQSTGRTRSLWGGGGLSATYETGQPGVGTGSEDLSSIRHRETDETSKGSEVPGPHKVGVRNGRPRTTVPVGDGENRDNMRGKTTFFLCLTCRAFC